jgi:twitching motility protein PilT
MLAESIRGVVAQQLLRTTDGKRCAALEVLKVNAAAANLIREGKTFQLPSIMQTGRRDGMQLMDQALQDLVKAEKISIDEATRFAVNKGLFSPQS